MRVENENRDILLSAQAVDGSRSSVATGRANHSEMVPFLPNLSIIPSNEEIFKQISQKLQRNIFECVCGAVKKLKQMQIVLLTERDEWGDV